MTWFNIPVGGSGSTSSSASYSAPWLPWQTPAQDIYTQAGRLFGQPAPAYYPGSTVAPHYQEQVAANRGLYDQAMGGTGLGNTAATYYGGALNQAAQGLTGLAGIGSGTQLGGNPFLDSMYNRGAQRITQSHRDTVQPGINAMFRGANAGGGTPHALATGQANRHLGQSLSDFGAQLYGTAYNQDANRQMQALQGLANTGTATLGQTLGTQQSQFNPYLMARGAGDYFQQQAQRELDADVARHNYESGGGQADWLTHYANMILGHPVLTAQSQSSGVSGSGHITL